MAELPLDYNKLGLVDERNLELVNQILNDDIVIDLVKITDSKIPYWSMYFEPSKKIVHIYAGKKINDENGFTHELLHVIEEKNHFPHGILSQLISLSESVFKIIFNDFIVSHINNVILHYRMYPKYIELGFKANKFVFDYYKKPRIIKKLIGKFSLTHKSKVRIDVLQHFLSNYFAHRFHTNKYITKYYEKNFMYLYDIVDKQLLIDLEDLCDKWKNKTILKNEDFFKYLLVILDSWKNRNNYC